MRVPAEGSDESGVAERIVMNAPPPFAGRVKLPVKTAPAARRIVSPGRAASMAACRFPPAPTEMVAARAAHGMVSTHTGSRTARLEIFMRQSATANLAPPRARVNLQRNHGWGVA